MLYEVETGKKENLVRISYNAFNPSAEDEDEEYVEQIPITGIYAESEAELVVSVNIRWDDTVFTYSASKVWDTERLEETIGEGSWSDGALGVTVENRSNQEISASFSFRSAAVDGDRVISEITGEFTKDSFVLAAASSGTGSSTDTSYFSVTGGKIFAEEDESFSIGSITVTISCTQN